MIDTDSQDQLVLWAYIVQWATIVMPPFIIASLIYLLVIRNKITNPDIRTHVSWQLATCGLIAVLIAVGFGLLVIGLSGFNSDSPLSILATFALSGATALFFPWLFYRLIYGTVRFSRQQPMERLVP